MRPHLCVLLFPPSVFAHRKMLITCLKRFHVCVSMCGYVHVCAGPLRGQKRESESLELELEAV